MLKPLAKNHYSNSAKTCDECGKEPKNKTLIMDRYRYLWCLECWPYLQVTIESAEAKV